MRFELNGCPVELEAGVIDGAALRAFTHGACGAMAAALHLETGWPIVAITDSHNVESHVAGGGSALHWAVLHPSGKALDVRGLRDLQALVSEFEGYADDGAADWGRSSMADLREWYVESQGEPIPISVARGFVAPLLASIAQTEVKRDRGPPEPEFR